MQGKSVVFIAALCVAFASAPNPASADLPADVESARGNARAGGPVSPHDAELLKRWGCTSGTRSRACRR